MTMVRKKTEELRTQTRPSRANWISIEWRLCLGQPLSLCVVVVNEPVADGFIELAVIYQPKKHVYSIKTIAFASVFVDHPDRFKSSLFAISGGQHV